MSDNEPILESKAETFFYQRNVMSWLPKFSKIGWVIFTAIIGLILTTSFTFIANNIGSPKDEKLIQSVSDKQIKTDDKVNTIFIKTIVIEGSVNVTNENVKNLQQDFKDFVKEMRDRDIINHRDFREIKANTKK